MRGLMKKLTRGALVWAAGIVATATCGYAFAEQGPPGTMELTGGACRVAFGRSSGQIVAIRQVGQDTVLLRNGEAGLWSARFRDGNTISAAQYDAGSDVRRFSCAPDGRANVLRMEFRGPELSVAVTASGTSEGVELEAQVAPAQGVVMDFSLPASLRFDPERMTRFVSPLEGHMGVGASFRANWFARQDPCMPSSWRAQSAGPKAHDALFGAGLEMRDLADPPVKLTVTEEGRKRLGADLARRLEAAQVTVNRPSSRKAMTVVLVDSPNGPYLAGGDLGGKGLLWRLGGSVGSGEITLATEAVTAVIDHLAASGGLRRKLGVVSLTNGPARGNLALVPVADWLDRLTRLAQQRKMELVQFASPEDMSAAIAGDDLLAVLNPYGEALPVPQDSTLTATVERIGAYVRRGGHWFEVGGYSFYSALQPARYLGYSGTYPPVFADFQQLDAPGASACVYRVQPRTWAPWQGAKDANALFVPGRLSMGGDPNGGHCERSFATYVPGGQSWRSPRVRLAAGGSASDNLRAYARANGITRRLEDKMSPAVLDKFRQAVLVKYQGTCREMADHLDKLPVPSLIHITDYLKGGFDKEYPDHLPPSARCGTPEEFRAFFDQARGLGHLMMPYTNPTWWCDHPRGPTFEREGEAPLLRNLDGKLSYERYDRNDGYTICHWHGAVQAANRATVRQFTREYPVDVLFQDQCGARAWRYDTNPASPSPYAYMEGLLSMVQEDSRTVPLSTEDAWDGVVNWESQLCGLTFAVVPQKRPPAWSRLMRTVYAPATWDIFPVAQILAHDKAAMAHHDLGMFVTNRPVMAYTLGLGYGMSYSLRATALEQEGPRQWLRWLDRVQKSICARYIGRGVGSFDHNRGGATRSDDDGMILARYGPVELACNLGPDPRRQGKRELAGFGFTAQAPGMVAGNLKTLGELDFGPEGISFITEGDANGADVWVFSADGGEVAVELPFAAQDEVTLAPDGQQAIRARPAGAVLRFRLRAAMTASAPATATAARTPRLWHAKVGR